MDGLVDLEKLNIRKGPASFFPTTTVSQNKKVRKGSIQMHFRRQIKATDYSRKVCGTVNVKLEGKHMNT